MNWPDLHPAEWVNLGLIAAGGLVLVVAATVTTIGGRWRSALSLRRRREGTIDLLVVSMVLLLFFLMAGLLSALGRSMDPPSGVSEDLWIGDSARPGLWPILSNNVAKAVLVLITWVVAVRCVKGGVGAFGFRLRRLRKDLVWAVLAYLAVWPLCTGLAHLATWLSGAPPKHGVLNLVREETAPLWAVGSLWLTAVVVSPVAEELFFRGLVQTAVRNHIDRPWLAIGIASVCFGLMHYQQPQFVLPLVCFGLALGYVYEHTGSLVGPILMHVLFNSRTMLIDLWMRAG